MSNPAQIPLRSTTQDYLDIEDIAGDIVILKDGSAAMIVEVSALNFGLLSEKEQDATIYAYGQLLNSLTFSIQIVVISKQKDVTDYIKLLDDQLAKTTAIKIQQQLVKYRDFVKAIVRQGNVLDKKFYVAIPFSSLELGVGSTLTSLTKKRQGLPRPKQQILERAITQLAPKRDHLVRLLARIGLRAHQLTNPQLLQLFFDFYNRGHSGVKAKLSSYEPTPI